MSDSDATFDRRERLRSRSRGSLSSIMAFLLGIPLGVGFILLFLQGPLKDTPLARYVSHPVEMICLVLFWCAFAALLTKVLAYGGEMLAFRAELLPHWEGRTVPPSEAGTLLDDVQEASRRVKNTTLGRRVINALDFVDSRQSANDLDDQLRSLADNDDIALENSYSLIRFITWAIPILGFLGTVLGITGAVSNVTPEVLENQLSKVTDGLGVAFDTTAVALALTMVTMFLSFVVERMEQELLEKVNTYADEELAHRFERTTTEAGSEVADLVRQSTQSLIRSTEQLVTRQADLWTISLQEARHQWEQTGDQQKERISAGIEEALQRTLESHNQQLAQQEEKSQQGTLSVLEQLREVSNTVKGQTTEQQQALASLIQSVAAQTEMLSKLVENGSHLVNLQEVMQQNLQTLAGAGSFEEAVSSLTAAIHLLTNKVGSSQLPGGNRLIRPGKAA